MSIVCLGLPKMCSINGRGLISSGFWVNVKAQLVYSNDDKEVKWLNADLISRILDSDLIGCYIEFRQFQFQQLL